MTEQLEGQCEAVMRDAIEGVIDAHRAGTVVRVLRHQIDPEGAEIIGIVEAYSVCRGRSQYRCIASARRYFLRFASMT